MDFLSKILPRTGVYVLTLIKNGIPQNKFYDSVEDMATAITAFDKNPASAVYHACATFKEPTSRKGENAGWMRSFWLDIDVGKANDARSYDTLKEAIAATVEALKTLRLPSPMFIQSGMGLHLYFVLDEDITKEQWLPVAKALGNALDSIGFKHDPSRTKDVSSVLRPVGSTWRKNGEEREVKLLRDCREVPLSSFDHIVEQFGTKALPAAVGMFAVTDDLGTIEYPPSSALKVIRFCGAVREAAEARGAVSEPFWRGMLGVVKNCVEGDDLCHDWSMGDPRYSFDDTQKKIDGWTSGPTTCAYFSEHSTQCGNCQYNGKIKSPIQLGIEEADEPQKFEVKSEDEVIVESEPTQVTLLEVKAPAEKTQTEVTGLKGYHWNGFHLSKLEPDENGVLQPIPFARQLFVVTMRVRNPDGVSVARCSRMVYDGVWRDFEFETELIPQKTQLAAALAANEIYTIGKNGQTMVQQYIIDHLEALRGARRETVTYGSFGWHDANSRFIIGNTAITKKEDLSVLVEEDANLVTTGTHGKEIDSVAGDINEWAACVDELYNVEGAEAAQFIILSSFAAPLIELMGLDGWHGIPIGITGEGGKGKTKVANVACSIYAPASALQVQANNSGMTSNIRTTILGRIRNLPIVFDEITGIPPQELADLFYGMSAGRGKIRMMNNGKVNPTSRLRWNTITYITCQSPIEQVLNGVQRVVMDATSLRCFSINVDVDKGWNFMPDKELVESLVNNNYGVVGRHYLKVLMHKPELIEKAVKFVDKYAPSNIEENERYYRRLVATAIFAGRVAKTLGYVKFDLEKVQAWAEEHIVTLRGRRGEATFSPEDYLGSFLGSIMGGTIVTQHMGDARTAVQAPTNQLTQPPVARRITDKANPRLIVATKALADWCRDNKVDLGWLKAELTKKGYILTNTTENPLYATGKVFRLGVGTTIQTPSVRVLELCVQKLSGSVELQDTTNNVVSIR